jgi:hypothetical protein
MPLEGRQAGEDADHQLPMGRGRVAPGIRQGSELGTLGADRVEKVEKVPWCSLLRQTLRAGSSPDHPMLEPLIDEFEDSPRLLAAA